MGPQVHGNKARATEEELSLWMPKPLSQQDQVDPECVTKIEAYANRSADTRRQEVIDGRSELKRKPDTPGKVLKPANAFILYRKCYHDQMMTVLKKHPIPGNSNFINRAFAFGMSWRMEPETVQTRFYELAKANKRIHYVAFPDYTEKGVRCLKRKGNPEKPEIPVPVRNPEKTKVPVPVPVANLEKTKIPVPVPNRSRPGVYRTLAPKPSEKLEESQKPEAADPDTETSDINKDTDEAQDVIYVATRRIQAADDEDTVDEDAEGSPPGKKVKGPSPNTQRDGLFPSHRPEQSISATDMEMATILMFMRNSPAAYFQKTRL